MKDQIRHVSRRDFLRISAAGIATGVLTACGATERPNAAAIPDMTQATADAIEVDNFNQIREAKAGQTIVLENYILHGTEHVQTGFPFKEHEANIVYAVRTKTSDPNAKAFASWIIGADCVLDYMKENNFFGKAQTQEVSRLGAKIERTQLNNAVYMKEMRAVVGPEIPNAEGAKILYLVSAQGLNQDVPRVCVSPLSTKDQLYIAGVYFGAEKLR